MGRYRKIETRIWNDQKFLSLSDDAQLVFLFVLTHPHMTSVGAMRASLSGLADERKWDVKRFRERFREGCQKGLLACDEKACFVAIPRFLKYNPLENPNVVLSLETVLDSLPECELKVKLVEQVTEYCRVKGDKSWEAWETVSKRLGIPFDMGMPNQEPEPEPNQEPNQDKTRDTADAVIPAELLFLIDGWNAMGNLIVKEGNGANRNPPAKAVIAGWKRCTKDRETRDAFADIPPILNAIQSATFCHRKPWFTLPWLFAKNNKDEWNILRLLSGGYVSKQINGTTRVGAGQRHDPNAIADPNHGKW